MSKEFATYPVGGISVEYEVAKLIAQEKLDIARIAPILYIFWYR